LAQQPCDVKTAKAIPVDQEFREDLRRGRISRFSLFAGRPLSRGTPAWCSGPSMAVRVPIASKRRSIPLFERKDLL
jgi:hypothetical protein